MNKKMLAIVATILVAASGAGYYIGYDIGYEKAVKLSINGFEDCAAAGYPIMESYPEQCAVPGGKSYTKNY